MLQKCQDWDGFFTVNKICKQKFYLPWLFIFVLYSYILFIQVQVTLPVQVSHPLAFAFPLQEQEGQVSLQEQVSQQVPLPQVSWVPSSIVDPYLNGICIQQLCVSVF